MQTLGERFRPLAIFALIGWISGQGSWLRCQTILSGAELENACQQYADKAVKYAKEWELLQCQKKLSVSPQLMDTDRNYHLTRCRNSVGTTISADLQSMEKDLIPCRGNSGGLVTPPTTPERPPITPPPSRRDYPPPITRNAEGDLWDILVINSADLARSEHSFRIGTLNGQFAGQNARAGGPEFSGQVNGSIFEAVMTDRTGYRANFIGHLSRPGLIEGTGCDNRGRGFSFSMTRR
jgi:hypothetical protein